MRDRATTLRRLALIASLACAAATTPAYAFADDDARRAILELRQQFEQSQRAQLQLSDQIQALQQQLAQLRGQIEELSRPQPQQQAAGNAQQGAATAPGGPVADPQEAATYNNAIDLFRKGQYKESSDSLSAFVALYPNSDLAPSARFYQGSSRYALKDFKGAITQLNSLVQDAPNDARAPDALLVIAGSQIELNNRAAAKATLQKLISQYPSTQAASTAKSRLQLLQ
ncbi:MAG TPA: tol-pal system protein YbgF [Bordetella sp.]